MGFTTRLGLRSRTARLSGDATRSGRGSRLVTGLSPSRALRPGRSPPRAPPRRARPARPQFEGGAPPILGLGFSRFARRYWGNPGWLLFLRLVICLSPAGAPARSEVAPPAGYVPPPEVALGGPRGALQSGLRLVAAPLPRSFPLSVRAGGSRLSGDESPSVLRSGRPSPSEKRGLDGATGRSARGRLPEDLLRRGSLLPSGPSSLEGPPAPESGRTPALRAPARGRGRDGAAATLGRACPRGGPRGRLPRSKPR